MVFGLREREGQVKAKLVTTTDKESLQNEICSSVKKGTTVYTDEHRSYLRSTGYNHNSVNHFAKEFFNCMAHTNGIESVWAVLKRRYNGVYHNMSKKHLPRYIKEIVDLIHWIE